jgi:hypothetical protein
MKEGDDDGFYEKRRLFRLFGGFPFALLPHFPCPSKFILA